MERVVELLDICARVPDGILGLTHSEDGAIIDVIETAQQIAQSAQGFLAAGAGELDRRSAGVGDDSLAKRLGWKTPAGVIAAKAGISFGEAARAVDVGGMIRPHLGEHGEDLPADRPRVAAAVLSGELPLAMAQRIDRTLDQIAWHLSPADLATVERGLVTQFVSGRFSVAKFIQHCAEMVEQFDVPGAKQRDKNRRQTASIRETWLPDGSLQLIVILDPERAAFYKTAVNLRTNPRRQQGGTPTADEAADEAADDAADGETGTAATTKGEPGEASDDEGTSPSTPTEIAAATRAPVVAPRPCVSFQFWLAYVLSVLLCS